MHDCDKLSRLIIRFEFRWLDNTITDVLLSLPTTVEAGFLGLQVVLGDLFQTSEAMLKRWELAMARLLRRGWKVEVHCHVVVEEPEPEGGWPAVMKQVFRNAVNDFGDQMVFKWSDKATAEAGIEAWLYVA